MSGKPTPGCSIALPMKNALSHMKSAIARAKDAAGLACAGMLIQIAEEKSLQCVGATVPPILIHVGQVTLASELQMVAAATAGFERVLPYFAHLSGCRRFSGRRMPLRPIPACRCRVFEPLDHTLNGYQEPVR